jgi:NADH-quinone oxidoreductase subunit H
MTAYFQSTFLGEYGGYLVANIALILLIALPVMLAVAMLIYADRKIWAAMALRRGPNVVGPFGLLQSFADGLKVFLQETIIPSAANRGLFLIAPIITFTVALIVWAVVPFGPGMMLSDINVGLLYILAASSLGVYGVIIAGWASNSKYPFYSALRAAAQMVSYEVSIGFILISVVLWSGSFNMSVIVEMQRSHLWITNGYGFNPLFFPMAVMFFISSLAETARAPFDLTEAESELVAGYQTEYSSMSFALYWLGEYANVILMCALNAILFWGGYLPPIDWAPLYVVPGIIWLFIKILVFFFLFSWVKATVPRYRYDQLMRLGWKIFLPISLLWVVLVSGYLMLTRYGPHADAEVARYGARVGETVLISARCRGSFNGEEPRTNFVITRETRAGKPDPAKWSINWPTEYVGQAVEVPLTGLKSDPVTRLSWTTVDGRPIRADINWIAQDDNSNFQGAALIVGLKPGFTPWAVCRSKDNENVIYD